MKSLIALLLTFFIFSNSYSQCNTNTSICTPGIAGPFSFISASANPSSCLDYYNSAASPNYAYIILYITTGGNLNLLINGDQTTGFLDVSIFDITNATDPCVELSLGTEIGCNYASAYDGCNEFGSTFPCSSEVPAPIVSAGDVIMILVEDWSNVMTSFTLELSNFPGSAQTGSPNPTINPVSPLCISDNPIQLSAVNPGGFWSGVGVSSTGVFNPLLAGPGIFTVNYSIGTAPCNASAYTIVTVLSPSADAGSTQIVCLGSTVTIGADPVCNSEGAIYSWNNGGSSGIINLSGANQDHGQTNVSPISTTTYELTISDGGCIATSQVTVSVDLPPTALNPISINLECIGDVPVPNISDVISVSDDYTSSPLVTFISDISNGNTCPEIITRTYSVTDDCGNFTDVQQLIIIGDVTPPVFLLPPASVTVQCSADVPSMTNLSYTDNCDASGTVSGTDGPLVGGTCGGTITRTWTVTDACGNVSTPVTQIIIINDNIAPVMSAAPAGIAVQCSGDVPSMTNLSYTDNCDASGTVSGTDGPLVGGTCGGTITRTWTVTDACGNVSTPVTQIIIINDNIAPVMSAAPAGIAVQCSGDVPSMTNLGYTDNCDASGTVAGTDGPLVGGTCGGTITRTWTVTDACGNVSTPVTQIIIINDNIAPVMSAAPAGIAVQCSGDVPSMTNLSYTDNCDASGTVSGTDGPLVGGTCGGTITRTWTVTDACGNVSTPVTQIIIINDNIAPVMSAAPAGIAVQCSGDVPSMTNLSYTDNCDASGTVSGTDGPLVGGTCGGTITRTWTVTDACGNVSTPVTQIIIINDNIAPVMSAAPAGITVQCSGDVPAVTNLGYTDNCDASGTVSGTDGPLVGGTCGGTITRTWTWTDACGNVSTPVTQIIIINDNIAPVMSAAPAGITVQCSGDVPAMTNLGYTDNCDASGTVSGTDGPLVGGTCGGTITRTWTWTDACGNVSTPVTQIIIINDNIAPVMSAAPAGIAVQCSGDVPSMTNLSYTDNCDASGTVSGTDGPLVGGTCGGTITRTWTWTDACGNVSTPVTQIIIINDNIAPVMSAAPAGIAVQCSGDVPSMTNLGYTDNCDASGTVSGTDGPLVGGTCGGTITRTWTVDRRMWKCIDSGNSNNYNQR